jgi:hypothetical protein
MTGQGGDGPPNRIQSGDPVEVQDLDDAWLPAVARSDIETRHGFPVIWVAVPGVKDPMPWPAEHVRHYPQPVEGE